MCIKLSNSQPVSVLIPWTVTERAAVNRSPLIAPKVEVKLLLLELSSFSHLILIRVEKFMLPPNINGSHYNNRLMMLSSAFLLHNNCLFVCWFACELWWWWHWNSCCWSPRKQHTTNNWFEILNFCLLATGLGIKPTKSTDWFVHIYNCALCIVLSRQKLPISINFKTVASWNLVGCIPQNSVRLSLSTFMPFSLKIKRKRCLEHFECVHNENLSIWWT